MGSIENFSLQVILPSLLSHGLDSISDGPDRAFLATLLSHREVLALNAPSIFFPAQSPRLSPFHSIQGCAEEQAGKNYFHKLLGTAVIMVALENGGAYARAKIPEFSLAIQGYDQSSEAFVSNLLPVRTCGVISEGCNGTNKMTHHEALAWKASFDNARNCHPIVRNQIWKRNGKIFRQKQHVNLPEGNACAVFMVENIPSEDLHRKERKEMEEKRKKWRVSGPSICYGTIHQ